MAGSEREGVEAARADLYEGSHCLLIKHKYTAVEALPKLEAFWRAVGCRHVTVATPEEHDRWVAAVSHLPHALAVCLVNLLAELSGHDNRIASVIGSGFRDTTRVAAGPPFLWQDILMSNREEICAMINQLRHHLSRLETALQSGEERRLLEQLQRASTFRQALEMKRRVRQDR
jgi:prephenate dehydrogenase